MALIGYNERILDLTVGAPGSTHDPRLSRNTGLYKWPLVAVAYQIEQSI